MQVAIEVSQNNLISRNRPRQNDIFKYHIHKPFDDWTANEG
jgi:hypothetical protein